MIYQLFLMSLMLAGLVGCRGEESASPSASSEPSVLVVSGCDSIIITAGIPPGDTTHYFVMIAEQSANGATTRRFPIPPAHRLAVPLLDTATTTVMAQLHHPGDYVGLNPDVVPRQCGDQPVPGALPTLIWSVRSYEEAREIFHQDSLLYPAFYERYLPFWWGELASGIGPDTVLRAIDNLSGLETPAQRTIVDIGRAAALWYGGRQDAAITVLDGVASSRSIMTLAQLGSTTTVLQRFAALFLEGQEARVHGSVTAAGTPAQRNRALQSIGALALQLDNIHLIRYLLGSIFRQAGDHLPDAQIPVTRQLLVAADRHLVEDDPGHLHAGSLSDLLPFVVDLWRLVGEPEHAVAIYRQHLAAWRAVPEWSSMRSDDEVRLLPRAETELSLAAMAGEAAWSMGDTVQAITLVRTAFTGLPFAAASPRSFVAYQLASWYLAMGDLDNARVMTDSAARLNSPFVSGLRRSLDSLATLRGLPHPVAAVRPEMSTQQIPEDVSLPSPVASALQSGRPYAIVFTSETCGSCVRYSPGVVAAINGVFPERSAIILASQEQGGEMLWRGKGYPAVLATPDLRKTYKVAMFPAVIIGRGRQILRRWDEFNEHTASDVSAVLRAIH